MKHPALPSALCVCLILLLTACSGPRTPQEVTSAFWEAVVNTEVDDVVETSTLTEAKFYDGFSKDWAGYQPSFGKVIIDGKAASVETSMNSPANSGLPSQSFTTYLVLDKGGWKVDYDRTRVSIHGGPLGELFGKLNQVGEDLSRQLESSADALEQELERLGRELEQKSESFGEQATKSFEQYAEQLRDNLKALEESINRALKDENKNLTDEDKRVLREIAADLDEDRESLSEPSVEAVTRGGKHVGEKHQQLEAIDNDALDEYKKAWRELGIQLESDLRQLMDELSSGDTRGGNAEKSF